MKDRRSHLDQLENQSIYIIREAFSQFKNSAVLWSMGKDSTAMLWLMRQAFLGKIPFPVVHIDTTHKFAEIYEFRDKLAKEWGLDLRIAKNEGALGRGVGPDTGKLECCTELKTNALKMMLEKYKFDALYLAIRRDEHGIRAKERVVSPRDGDFTWDYQNQPPEMWDHYRSEAKKDEHVRIHPILAWREINVWEYVAREGIPVIELYFAKNGKRYRSIGCECCCEPVASEADTVSKVVEELKTTKVSERSGRAQDKEQAYMMQKLRSLGYM